MVTPDDKDWTWVLARHCPECGFDASACRADAVPALVRQNALTWNRLLETGVIKAGRPDPSTWSSLEYACHVRDVYARFDQRFALMLAEDDPLFPNWDQDATAVAERYDDQVPTAVVAALATGAAAMAERLEGLTAAQWERSGRRSNGSLFTVATLARYTIHDPVHHVWDVTRPVG